MKLTDEIVELLSTQAPQDIRVALSNKLTELGFEEIAVEDVIVQLSGDIIVVFSDEENDMMEVLFSYDEEDGAEAFVFGDDVEDDGDNMEVDSIDLDVLDAPVVSIDSGKAIDLINLDWITEDLIQAMLLIGDILDGEDQTIEEATTLVVRGGKKVRVPLVRRRRRKRLTPKQRAGIRKGVRKRQQKKGAILRKRKKSLKLRKRVGIKRRKAGSRLKVKGTRS